ncbi:MAG: 5-(carboxyamino)imidazole ribonucleotide synthase [Gammaproteobacteria bacterium]|nr:5-(carboxyamino)imidazole ribonucleotide synthase [Gammaproteobacteria bacterium]
MIIGIVGGGQLARMMALAGIPLGMRFIFLDPAEDACAAPLGEHLCGHYDNTELLSTMADKADVVTYEFENVPESAITFLADKVDVYPAAQALATARDRIHEKRVFQDLGISTVPFAPVGSFDELQDAVRSIGLPAILKTRTMGYDGKGQFVLRHSDDLESAWNQLGDAPLILEGFANFRREISVISVRGRDGEMRFYPLSENHHRDGILHTAHSLPDDPEQSQAEDYARRIMEKLDYVGVMALELFDTGDKLLANEMAPRVHNSGHWTIEGAVTSQFENHLRAVLGLPLGSTKAKGYATMVNLIGTIPDTSQLLSEAGIHLHSYSKKPYPGRKVGHATVWSASKPTRQKFALNL